MSSVKQVEEGMVPDTYIFCYLVTFLACLGTCFFQTKSKAGPGWVQTVGGVFGVWILSETLLFYNLAGHPRVTDDDLFVPQFLLLLNTVLGLTTVSLISIATYKGWIVTKPSKLMQCMYGLLAVLALPFTLWIHRSTLHTMQMERDSWNRLTEPADRSTQTRITPAR